MVIKSAVLGSVVFVGGLLAASAMAAEVVITDAANANVSCGKLTNLSSTPGQVSLTVSGQCIGASSGTPVVQNVNLGSVPEGGVASKDVAPGSVVKLPMTVSITTQPQLNGASASVSGTTVVYTPPQPGTLSADSSDSFTYSIKDGAGTASGEVIVSVTQSSAPPPGAGCAPSTAIECKGELNLKVPYSEVYVEIDAGKTHVWTIKPENRNSWGQFLFYDLTTTMNISLSPSYLQDSTAEFCFKTKEPGVGQGAFYYNEAGGYGKCDIEPGTTYFLRITSQKAGYYNFSYY